MIRKIIAYNSSELEKRYIADHCKMLFKSKLLSENQYSTMAEEYKTDFFSPKIVMRILLFLGAFLGVSTITGPTVLVFEGFGETAIQIALALVGFTIIFFCEKLLIQTNHHFRSGVTEAMIYTGVMLVYFGIFGLNDFSTLTYIAVGFAMALIIAIRYLDRFALLVAIILCGAFLFELCLSIGESTKVALPFMFIAAFLAFYLGTVALQKKSNDILLLDHFILLKSVSLLVIYIAGNYFVVRELSVELMGISLAEGEDIPFGWFFIGYTVALPLAYLFIGIIMRSILFIRIALLVLTLAVITIKIYFLHCDPVVLITIGGAILIGASLLVFNYLKTMKNGFTRDKILSDKWDSEDLSAYIISQASINVTPTQREDELFKGGNFGGGGAGSNF